VIVRCTKKTLDLLDGGSITLSELPPARRRLVSEPALDRSAEVHPAHRTAARCSRPSEQVCVARISARSGTISSPRLRPKLHAESLPADTFSELEPGSVRLAKTASRSTLGFMDEMAFELRYLVADADGLGRCDIDVLNHGLRRALCNRGEYVRPIELVARRLTSRTGAQINPGRVPRGPPVARLPRGRQLPNSTAPVCEPYGVSKNSVRLQIRRPGAQAEVLVPHVRRSPRLCNRRPYMKEGPGSGGARAQSEYANKGICKRNRAWHPTGK
jgi:hypothetical protein